MLRNILAVIAGIIVGALVNGAIIAINPSLVPPPEGADLTTVEGLQASMHLLQPKHFLMPFLAHAIGTLVGAFVAVKIAATHRAAMAYTVGVFSLCGGILASVMIPAPAWFKALDLIAAYIPMAWLAVRMGGPATPRY